MNFMVQGKVIYMGQVLLLNTLFVLSASGSYWTAEGDRIKEKTTMALMDIRFGFFTQPTYYAYSHHWIFSGQEGNRDAMAYYAGTAYNNHGMPKRDVRLNTSLQWSGWPCNNKRPTIAHWGFPGANRNYVLGEGASCGVRGNTLIEAKQWYRHLFRFWRPSNPVSAEKITYMGWWMNDLEGDRQWHLVNVVELPIGDARFATTGLGGFVELFGPADTDPVVQTQSWRNLYTHKDGKWESADNFHLPTPAFQKLTLSQDRSEVTLEVCPLGPFKGVTEKVPSAHAKLKQPSQPKLGQFLLASSQAIREEAGLIVSWATLKSSTPILKTRIEVLGVGNEVLLVDHVDLPSTEEIYLELPTYMADRATAVRLQFTDVFGRLGQLLTTIKQVPVERRMLPVKLASIHPGVKTTFYELSNGSEEVDSSQNYTHWNKFPDLERLQLVRTVFQSAPSLDAMPRNFAVAARVESYLRVERDGLYRFHFSACDGGRLILGEQVIINQKMHGSGNSMSAWRRLAKGLYPVVLEHYSDTGSGTEFIRPKLELEFEGPGISRMVIPARVWALPAEEHPNPELAFSATAGNGEKSNLVTLRFGSFSGDPQEVEYLEVVGEAGVVWLSVDFAKSSQSHVLMMPEGSHKLSARLRYKNNTIIDLTPVKVDVKNPPISGWQLAEPGRVSRPFGCTVHSDRVVFMGDGCRWATREVTGDFVFTMRMKRFGNAVAGEVIPNDPRAHFGFFLQPNPVSQFEYGKGFNWYKSMYYGGRFDTPTRHDAGLNQTNWQSSYHQVPTPSCQFRFTRRGEYVKSELRASEEEEWSTVFEEISQLPDTVFIGPYMNYSPDSDSKAFWKIEFDQLSLQQKKN